MAEKHPDRGATNWLGGVPDGLEDGGTVAEFNGGKLWVGVHSADRDTLVFDPAESDASAEHISFYSLTQHRRRSFPRSVVSRQISEITDAVGLRQATGEYENRRRLRQEHAAVAAAAEAERLESRRQGVIEAHHRYLDAIGREYRGVAPTGEVSRLRRRTKCRVCGIGLDDFAGTACLACRGVLCSCGACACTATADAAHAT